MEEDKRVLNTFLPLGLCHWDYLPVSLLPSHLIFFSKILTIEDTLPTCLTLGLRHMNGTIQTLVIRIRMWWRISSVYLILSGSTSVHLCNKVRPWWWCCATAACPVSEPHTIPSFLFNSFFNVLIFFMILMSKSLTRYQRYIELPNIEFTLYQSRATIPEKWGSLQGNSLA